MSVSFGSVCWNRGNSGAAASKPTPKRMVHWCIVYTTSLRLSPYGLNVRAGSSVKADVRDPMGGNRWGQILSRCLAEELCAPAPALSGDDSGRAVGLRLVDLSMDIYPGYGRNKGKGGSGAASPSQCERSRERGEVGRSFRPTELTKPCLKLGGPCDGRMAVIVARLL